ncbi:hypothetical protein SAMN05446935_2934 [Burkholderia sp. YR290]|nr:hypothetical protein SAMN05446935_2934 [Burkholderia sp. YR290]
MALPQEKQLTVNDFKVWFSATQAKRAAHEAKVQRETEANVVGFVMREMRKGFSLDEAGDKCLKIGKRQTGAVMLAVLDTLSRMGWKPKRERA